MPVQGCCLSLQLSVSSPCMRVELGAETCLDLEFISCTSWDRSEWGVAGHLELTMVREVGRRNPSPHRRLPLPFFVSYSSTTQVSTQLVSRMLLRSALGLGGSLG